MNRTLIAGSVIIGVAVMLSMSMIPAEADRVDNNCRYEDEGIILYCRKALSDGQHATVNMLNFDIYANRNPGCHYDVKFFSGNWFFTINHEPAPHPEDKCKGGWVFDPRSVVIRGS